MDVIKDWAPCHWNMQPGIVMSSDGRGGVEGRREGGVSTGLVSVYTMLVSLAFLSDI